MPAGHVENAANPPSRLVAQACQPHQTLVDGNRFAQWLSVQTTWLVTSSTMYDLLMLKANSSTLVLDGRDEVENLRKQLQHQQHAHSEMQTMLTKKPNFGNRNFPEPMGNGSQKDKCFYNQNSLTVRGLRTGRNGGCTTI